MFNLCRPKKSAASTEGRADDTPSTAAANSVEEEQTEEIPEEVQEPVSLKDVEFSDWLDKNLCDKESNKLTPAERGVGEWTEIRLFLSSTFIDTQAERDKLIKVVIPDINRKMASHFIRIIPVDLRWGVLAEETKSCCDIQKTCLNQIDNCRMNVKQTPWFLGLRTDRYGWVQSEMMGSNGFEKPEFYDWIDKLKKTDKTVSITSLEVCHAARTPQILPPFPTVFFYKRHFSEDALARMEKDKFKWVFEFEYTDTAIEDPDLKHQYSLNPLAEDYRKDKESLDKFLQDKYHVLFSDYQAEYVGDAYFTAKRDNAKSFGVGYAAGLDAFAEKVESDLLAAIKMNFAEKDADSIDPFVFDTIQHENAVKLKASTFVGREKMMKDAFDHVQMAGKDSAETTLILHGEPGCGKSGLLAAVAEKAMLELRGKDQNFVFVHAVDSCPGSNLLEKFLRRLHVNLRAFRRAKGEIKINSSPPESMTDLKQEHHSFIEEAARTHPNCKFIIIVDAVNQFNESNRAWDMWWLMRATCPANVRFIISTLNEENGTFANAKTSCPSAKTIEVTSMSKEDLIEMISTNLARYNKKLTTYDDKLLGNQMDILLSKSSSPLFLIAASEALRKFGIFEKVSEYIRSLPETITALFRFLIDEWCVEYGKMFTEDVCGLLALSKDGLLENQVNDILSFKEEREKGGSGFLYESSFSRIYDSLSSFLAAGGGGYLRFFHDQLKYTIRDKFLDSAFTKETHELMQEFFMSVIRPQLCPVPQTKTPDYYAHVLNQVIFHQVMAAREGGSFDCLNESLRNIYFVRERVMAGQQNILNDDYLYAIETAKTPEDVKALKLWAKFVQLYSPNIKESPDFAHNMALNQAPSSVVHKDTKVLEAPEKRDGYPLIWDNIPEADDPMSVKIPTAGVDCVASTVARDVFIVATGDSATIFDQSSGETLQKLVVTAYSVCLTRDEECLLVGDKSGLVHCFDVDSGAMVWTSDDTMNGCVTWIGFDNDGNVLAGTGYHDKAICWDKHSTDDVIMKLEGVSPNVARKFSCEDPAWHYTFNKATGLMASAHKGFISLWDIDKAEKICAGDDNDSGCVYSIDSHPSKNTVISGNNNLKVSEWMIDGEKQEVTIIRQIELPCLSGWAYGGVWTCRYSFTGDRIYCAEPHSQSIKIYGESGEKVGELKGHPDCVNCVNIVPGTTDEVISCDRGKISVLWQLSEKEEDIDACKQEYDEKVLWAGFSLDETHFVTVTETNIRIWDTASRRVIKSVDFAGFYGSGGGFYEDGKHLFINSKMNVLVYSFPDLELMADYEVLKTSDGSITAFAIAEDGTHFLAAECRNYDSDLSCAFIWTCEDPLNAQEKFIMSEYCGRLFSCDIAHDSSRALIGGHNGSRVIDLANGDVLVSVPDHGFMFSAFVPGTYDFVVDGGKALYRYDSGGSQVTSYFGHQGSINDGCFRLQSDQVITCSADGTVRIWGLSSGECLYTFFNHRSQEMKGVVVNKSGDLFLASNSNGMLYVLTP